jgi:hypothetical protein
MPVNNPAASTGPFIVTRATFAVYARIHAAGNTLLSIPTGIAAVGLD